MPLDYTNGMSSPSGGMTASDRAAAFVFDWNEVNRRGRFAPKNFSFFDETLIGTTIDECGF